MIHEFWLGASDGAPKRLNELLTLPSFNIRGMSSSRIGAQASNVIPSAATASIEIRLVKGMDYRQTISRVTEHIRSQGYYIVDAEPNADVRMSHAKVAKITFGEGYNAVRTSMDLPISQEVVETVESALGLTVKLPSMGASVPLDMIKRAVETRTIVIPIANHDDNQHSYNENLRLQNLWDGIELMVALLTMSSNAGTYVAQQQRVLYKHGTQVRAGSSFWLGREKSYEAVRVGMVGAD